VKHAKHEHMEHMAVEIHARFFSFQVIIVPVREVILYCRISLSFRMLAVAF
jgi:hypothetical protein